MIKCYEEKAEDLVKASNREISSDLRPMTSIGLVPLTMSAVFPTVLKDPTGWGLRTPLALKGRNGLDKPTALLVASYLDPLCLRTRQSRESYWIIMSSLQ